MRISSSPDPVFDLKRQLAAEINAIASGWSQWDIGVYLGLDQPRMSDLKNGRFHRFSLDRLVKILYKLDREIIIDIEHRTGKGIFVRKNHRSTPLERA